MLESLVLDVLNKFLGEYLTGIDKNKLKIGVWSGDVLIKDVGLN